MPDSLVVYDFDSRRYDRLVESGVTTTGTDWVGNHRILYFARASSC